MTTGLHERSSKEANFSQRGPRGGGQSARKSGGGKSFQKPYFLDEMARDPWTVQIKELCEHGKLDSSQLNINHDVIVLKVSGLLREKKRLPR